MVYEKIVHTQPRYNDVDLAGLPERYDELIIRLMAAREGVTIEYDFY